jgi:hypothetical protein
MAAILNQAKIGSQSEKEENGMSFQFSVFSFASERLQ